MGKMNKKCLECGCGTYYRELLNEKEFNIRCDNCNSIIDFYSYGIFDSENVNIKTQFIIYFNILKYNIKRIFNG